MGRGYCHAQLGEKDQAMKDYDVAVKNDPANPIPLCLRGKLKGETGDNRQALADFNQAVRIAPQSALPLMYRGDYMKKTRSFKNAMSDYNAAAELYKDQGNEEKYKDAMESSRELLRL
jgi:Flp pilus assembly protein TadD